MATINNNEKNKVFKLHEDGYYYSEKFPDVRFKIKGYEFEGKIEKEYIFEVKNKRNFFGLFRKKKWEYVVSTTSFFDGLDFCHFIIVDKAI